MNHNTLPLVSIITPFLNTEKYFEECLESVLSQTYPNWELMLIDDGSTDNSTHIAKSYAAKYPDKIFYLEHDRHINLGASASRNLGIKKSRGSFISFLDSDDIYLPLKLEEQVSILNNHPPAGMLYSATEYWYSWTGAEKDKNSDWIWNNFGVPANSLIQPPQLLTLFLKDGGTVPCMGSVLARRNAIEHVGGWENIFKYIYTDQVFHAKMCFHWPVFVAGGCWDKYRQHPESSCHVVEATNKAYRARYNYLTWLEKYLLDQGGNKNPDLWKAFNQAFWPYKHQYLNKILQVNKAIFNKLKRKLSI